MAKTRDIQRRIKSISSTKRITRAMEMVEAAKMRKAVAAVLASRTYANLSWETLLNIARSPENHVSHPLLETRVGIKKQALILITANRGLCGGFNSAIIAEAKRYIVGFEDITDIIVIGRKGEVIRNTAQVVAAFPKEETGITVASVSAVATLGIEGFTNKTYDRILVAFTDFISAAKQVPRIKQLLPVLTDVSDGLLGIFSESDKVGISQKFVQEKAKEHLQSGKFSHEYIFEPSRQMVLDQVVPRLVTIQLYQALLESTASEHSARMAAMHQATKAASDLVMELTLFYNKARQAAITAEIAEITAGVAAVT